MKTKNLLILLMLFISSVITAQVAATATPTQTSATEEVEVRYIYFPNMSSYYDKFEKNYIYKDGEEWVKAKELPKLFGGYSRYGSIAVEIKDYNKEEPQQFIKQHRKQFPYCATGRFTYETVATNFD